MASIHIFNPETDFALACGNEYYTPPKSVVALRRAKALTPARYADVGDAVMLLDDFSDEELRTLPEYPLVVSQGLMILRRDDELPCDMVIKPWGWNHALRRMLLNKGVAEESLPTSVQIDDLRRLSHRRTTIPFLSEVNRRLDYHPPYPLPEELDDYDSVMRWCAANPGGYLKAPWSSSGRGVMRVLRCDGEDLRGWVRGTLRRQGSILAEVGWSRRLDFATEWMVNGVVNDAVNDAVNDSAAVKNMKPSDVVVFKGYSVFNVDDHSQYVGNIILPQDELYDLIVEASRGFWSHAVVDALRDVIAEMIAPYYRGPLGIDALIDADGNVDLCVEINMRMTMGMVNFSNFVQTF